MSKALGSRLTQLRESLGLSKAEVARRLHVGNTTYSNWEYGLREPNVEMIFPFEPPIIKRLGEPCYISQFLPDCTYWSGTYYESSLS